jgi:hypothetical protein
VNSLNAVIDKWAELLQDVPELKLGKTIIQVPMASREFQGLISSSRFKFRSLTRGFRRAEASKLINCPQ